LVDNIIRSNCDYIFIGPLNNAGLEAVYECINVELNK